MSSGWASAYFFCPSRLPPRMLLALNVFQSSGDFFSRMTKHSRAEAEASARECLVIREKKSPDDWQTFNAKSILGGSLLGQKKYAEAQPLLISGYEGMKQDRKN